VSDAFRGLHECAHNFGAPKDALCGVAVSGGSDSVATLLLLHAHGRRLQAVTVDHGLRPEAKDEAAFVADLCRDIGVPHTTLEWRHDGVEGNLQAEARKARYRLIADWAKDRGIQHVALGHTIDDQAETFLMRVGRRAGIDGLTGMSSSRTIYGVEFQRPFLAASRKELRAYLGSTGQRWIEDPSNEDERFERIRVRRAIEALEGAGIDAEAIFEVTQNLSLVRHDLALLARSEFGKSGDQGDGDLIFDRGSFLANPVFEVKRRTLADALRWVSGADYPPRSDALADLSVAIRDFEKRTLHGCLITHEGDSFRISREHNAVKALRAPTTAVWDRWVLDGPHAKNLEFRALGEAVKDCPEWRATGLPRTSLLASPAVFDGEMLISAPLAGFSNGWTAKLAPGRDDFAAFLMDH